MNTIPNQRRDSNLNPPRGGQAHIGLFGVRDTAAPVPAPQPSLTERLKAASAHCYEQTYSQRARRFRPAIVAGAIAVARRSTVAVPAAGLALPMPKCWEPAESAMRLAAHAADERERRPSLDDEEADCARRCAGAGYVESTLATEGW